MGEVGKKNEGGERLTDEYLLTEVLSRLHVKYILRCKAVSKTWYSLISTLNFIKSHYQRDAITSYCAEVDNNEAATLIVRRNKDEINLPEEDGSYSLFQLGGSDDFIADLKFPFSRGDYPFTPSSLLVGCVLGFVCVCVDPYADICWPTCDKITDIYIWNPATRQSKLIPPHTIYNRDPDHRNRVALGFGYDPIDFDFKVVRVVSRTIFPEVYSANRDAWRNIEAKLIDVPYKFDICLHGFLFATWYNGVNNGMMAFNLNKEVFVCDIKLPITSNDPRQCYGARIADFRDSIAVIIYNPIIYNPRKLCEKINLWTLDDEACLRGGGVEASWTLMLSINVGVEFDYVQGLFNNVEFLLVDDTDRFSYNSDKKVARSIYNPCFGFNDIFNYTESQRMLLVAGSKLVNWSDIEDVSEESSIALEDDYEDYNEETNVDLEDYNEENNVDSEDGNEERTADSSKENEKSNIISPDENEENSLDSEDNNEGKGAHSGGE